MTYALLLAVTIVASATFVVLGALAIYFGALHARPVPVSGPAMAENDTVLIFRDETLVDCSDKARHLLESLQTDSRNLRAEEALGVLLRYLARPFPDIMQQLSRLAEEGELRLEAVDDSGMTLSARFQQGLTRIQLTDTRAEGSLVALDRLSFEALSNEVETLRQVARHVPALVWQTDDAARVVWANARYIAQLQAIAPEDLLTWPLPDLFDAALTEGVDRLQLVTPEQTFWFSYAQKTLSGRTLHIATPIDSAVQSEAARQETLQTLTRTFASLQIGLALFDAERRLQVFNPALVDMTRLEPLFLASRPSFEQVLYALREARMLPEPKDFNNWRREIIEMEKAAETGAYSEEWCLDGGQTFHVTGQPQPNGAIALFIEDVTTEAALSRSFRSEIETVHRVLDGLSDGIVTFSMAGQVLLANDAYERLWQTDPCSDLADQGLPQAIRLWSGLCEPTTFWARLAEFATDRNLDELPKQLSASIVRKDGVMIAVSAKQLTGGHLMLLFRQHRLRSGEAEHGLQAERALQTELVSRPDLALEPRRAERKTEPRRVQLALESRRRDSADPQAEQDTGGVPARKPRTARHVGTRLRV